MSHRVSNGRIFSGQVRSPQSLLSRTATGVWMRRPLRIRVQQAHGGKARSRRFTLFP
jgi:hypothetical protein